MAHQLPELPFARDALEPVISAETIDYHHGKHHKAYVDEINQLTEGTRYASMSLQEIAAATVDRDSERPIFNNAAQAWNHAFYWNCLAPGGGGEPTGAIAKAIEKSFGGFPTFKEKFSAAAAEHFGSGWAWLVKTRDGIAIETTANADTPMARGQSCLLTLDVWEHAYYIDYRNARPKYIDGFWRIVNWSWANRLLG